GIPPPEPKSPPKPVPRVTDETSSSFSYLLPVAVLVAYIAYKYVMSD
ncbi:11308_t:CDS:2, partial [Scutellospora calospora]